ncbi:MAG: serine hydrolase [Pseudomonadota bacterium]
MTLNLQNIDEIVARALPEGGAGAAVAVRRNGETVFKKGYGAANVETGAPFTPDTAFRICSVSKQFTCLLALLAEERGLLSFDDHPKRYLRDLSGLPEDVTLRHLATNQSGVKDYWCLAMLAGAKAESRFRRADADHIVHRMAELDFSPGARFAYSNTNFAILGWVLETVFDAPYADILQREIFAPLDMTSTFVGAVTSEPLPGGATGYEFNAEGDLTPAIVDIEWEGDAGIVSTLNDLLKWEANFEDNRIGPADLTARLTADHAYGDGGNAPYRYGVRAAVRNGVLGHSHTGALRGWRMMRLRAPEENTSVIVLFNHLTAPEKTTFAILDHVLQNKTQPVTGAPAPAPDGVAGRYFDAEAGLSALIEPSDNGLTLSCGGRTFSLRQTETNVFVAENDAASVRVETGASPILQFTAPSENVSATFRKSAPPSDMHPGDYVGAYTCRDFDSVMTITAAGAGLTVRFEGRLGAAAAIPLNPVDKDVFIFPCLRALDQAPPGEFTIVFERNESGVVSQAVIGCWLARHTIFNRTDAPGGG